jgi:hypothetical protein
MEGFDLMLSLLKAIGAMLSTRSFPGVDHNAWDPAYDRADLMEDAETKAEVRRSVESGSLGVRETFRLLSPCSRALSRGLEIRSLVHWLRKWQIRSAFRLSP